MEWTTVEIEQTTARFFATPPVIRMNLCGILDIISRESMCAVPIQIAWTRMTSSHVITGLKSSPMSNSNDIHMRQVYRSEEHVSHWMLCVMVWRTVLMAWMNGTKIHKLPR